MLPEWHGRSLPGLRAREVVLVFGRQVLVEQVITIGREVSPGVMRGGAGSPWGISAAEPINCGRRLARRGRLPKRNRWRRWSRWRRRLLLVIILAIRILWGILVLKGHGGISTFVDPCGTLVAQNIAATVCTFSLLMPWFHHSSRIHQLIRVN